MEPQALNPAQQAVLDLLSAAPHERPQFDAGLGTELRAELEAGMAPFVADLGEDPLNLNKHLLAQVHGCERKLVAEEAEPFAWTAPMARGSVAHKAVELSIHWKGPPVPLDLVDEAMAHLENDTDSLADWLQTASETDRAELRALAGERVTTFLETFPPLENRWRPVTESRVRLDLVGGRIVLRGRIDLSLGQAHGTTAGKVLIDLKTGGATRTHLDDLRFYALVETIRIGTPPRLLASYYLDAGRAEVEAVTEGLLEAALLRTVDGARKLIELHGETREPVARPGGACRWCGVVSTCAEGTAHLGEIDSEPDSDPIDQDD